MGTKAILLVDDEAIILMSLKQTLRFRYGDQYLYETALSAEGGIACIEKLFGEGVEVVLLISDWLMPGMTGGDFLSVVHRRYPNIQLIMVTGHADEAQMEQWAAQVNLHAFLRKPWRTEVLFEAIESALR